jgi:hypothetical protein
MSTQLLAAVARRVGSEVEDAIILEQFVPSDGAITSSTRQVLVGERPPAKEVA